MFTRRRPAVGAGAFYFARTIVVDAVRSERRETALHVAAKTGHVRTCAVLIRQEFVKFDYCECRLRYRC